jgi:uncharacterized membrane protein
VDSPVFRSVADEDARVCWDFRRTCSVSPKQLAASFALLAGASLTIGLFFLVNGVPMVLPFASLELLALGVAFLVYARHALDGERIWMDGPVLIVESERGNQRVRKEFHTAWVRIEPLVHADALIEISGQGQRVQVGGFVRHDVRKSLAHDLRRAVAHVGGRT